LPAKLSNHWQNKSSLLMHNILDVQDSSYVKFAL